MKRRHNFTSPRPPSRATPQLLKAIVAALAQERRPHIRKRLRALHLVTLGEPPEHAARLARTSVSWVGRWIKRAKEGGLSAITDDVQRLDMTQAEVMRR